MSPGAAPASAVVWLAVVATSVREWANTPVGAAQTAANEAIDEEAGDSAAAGRTHWREGERMTRSAAGASWSAGREVVEAVDGGAGGRSGGRRREAGMRTGGRQ